jgi:hypothetical protein
LFDGSFENFVEDGQIPVEHWYDIIGDPTSATLSWIASLTTLTAFNSPENACERRTPAIKLLTQT